MKEFDNSSIDGTNDFDIALGFIDELTGLELSICEKTALRVILRDSINRDKEVKELMNHFYPPFEAVSLFLKKYYNLDITSDSYSCMARERLRLSNKSGCDFYKEYFKRLQEESHYP